jgi:hypothetical protein
VGEGDVVELTCGLAAFKADGATRFIVRRKTVSRFRANAHSCDVSVSSRMGHSAIGRRLPSCILRSDCFQLQQSQLRSIGLDGQNPGSVYRDVSVVFDVCEEAALRPVSARIPVVLFSVPVRLTLEVGVAPMESACRAYPKSKHILAWVGVQKKSPVQRQIYPYLFSYPYFRLLVWLRARSSATLDR